MKKTIHSSLTACAALLSLGGMILTGCGGSNIAPLTGSTGTPRPGSPTPVPTGTPTAVPTATPTPNPTPTANPTPGSGSALSAYFGTLSNGTRLTYRDITTTTTPNPVTGQPNSETTTTTYTTGAANPFAFGNAGNSTQVTLATAQGNVTVTRQEDLEGGKVVGYTYYTLDNNAYTIYGSDGLDEQGRTTVRLRYNPGARFSLDLKVGQTATQAVQVTQTIIDTDDNTTTQTVYNQTFTLTFVGVESVTTPAGTYANAAKMNFNFTFNSQAQGESPALNATISSQNWYAASVGLVKSNTDSRFTTQLGENQNYETRTVSDVQLTSVAK